MIDPLHPSGDGQTPLSEESREGLIPTHISTLGDLYEAEQRNILKATIGRSPTIEILLDDKYLRNLHKRMFGDVWKWAGKYRLTETSIGFEPGQIPAAVRDLVADVDAWLKVGDLEPDEIAVRFHHRLVSIHPFPNGNGRHTRIVADYLIRALGRPEFTWGVNLGLDVVSLRKRYLEALVRADEGSIDELLSFARS